jgi:hypothetical protein
MAFVRLPVVSKKQARAHLTEAKQEFPVGFVSCWRGAPAMYRGQVEYWTSFSVRAVCCVTSQRHHAGHGFEFTLTGDFGWTVDGVALIRNGQRMSLLSFFNVMTAV